MSIHTTIQAAKTEVLAFDSVPIPGLSSKLDTFGGWVTYLSYFACIIALIAGGGFIAWDKITEGHNSKGVKASIGAVVGTMVIATSATIINAAQG